jgi:nucleotide-binding universal stress UspA family protein
MKQPPRSPKEHVINRDMAIGIGVIGVVDAIAILSVFFLALQRYPGHLEAAQTIAFVTLCSSELLRAFTARSEYNSVFAIGVFSNRWMVWAVGVSFTLVLLVVYVPFLQPFFDTVPLSVDDWLFMLPFFFASPLAMELLKLYFRRRTQQPPRPAFVRSSTGASSMQKILVPVGDDSANARGVMQQVVREFGKNSDMEVHLLNVQPSLGGDVSRFVPKSTRDDYHHEEAEKVLKPYREKLDRLGIPYSVHMEVGDKARCITETARRLRCDLILMGTSRKNSLTRLVESSVTNRVLELTTVPVEVIAGHSVSNWERYGIPAALAAVAAAFVASVS